MTSRSWRWLSVRILGLLSRPPTTTPDGRWVQSTRIALQLAPPPPPQEPSQIGG